MSPAPLANIGPPGQNPLIFVVDDDLSARLQTRFSLENEGLTIVEAAGGTEALACFAEHPADLVLLDVIMPDMDGFATCRAIRRLPGGAHVPIVMVTGLEDTETINAAFDAGATDFISKPINLLILGYRVRYWLRSGALVNELHSSQQRLFRAQEIARLGHWERNLTSDSFRLTCHRPELLGLSHSSDYEALYTSIVSSERHSVRSLVDEACRTGSPFRIHYRIVLEDGSERSILNQGEIVTSQQHRLAVGVIQDITELKQAEDKIRYLAFYDHLTGLANRALLKEHWTKILPHARRQQHSVALLFIDLDHFKRINDTMGHPCGDQVLVAVADRLKRTLRKSDIVGRAASEEPMSLISRVGGDEFTIIASGINSPAEVANLTERVLESLTQPFRINDEDLMVGASIGVSLYPEDGTDFDTLLKNADTAMYEAKERGRNNYQFFQAAMNDAARERFILSNRMRQALAEGEFTLYYQPQFASNDGRITGVEALIRWLDPTVGLIPPDRFLPFAEENGFIHQINDWVIRQACRQAQQWVAAGVFAGCRMGVNISGNNLDFAALGDKVLAVLAETGLAPHYLEMELTERVMMVNPEQAIAMLLRLKEIGVSIAIDDFGTGYSALSHLQLFPLTTLKIDKSFVRNLGNANNGTTLLRSIVGIAKSFQLKVVAEGVETEEQRAELGKMACDELQGYLLSRPVPAEQVEKQLFSAEQMELRTSPVKS
jgi:diguanylate cyclase (GGDEF)-like protein